MMSSDNDVNNTSAFLRDNPSFIDDECEEDREEIKDCCSDSEEERIYMEARGQKDFYKEDDFLSSDDDFLNSEESLNSSEFIRYYSKKF